ncbi:MAG: VWA domain-containing protein [Terriglobales bacterium]
MYAHPHIPLVVLALALTCTFTVAAQDSIPASEIPTYHSAVSEVRITFFATDDNNHSVATLSKSDVAVVDDEHVVRNFRNFTHSEETSLDVVALVDLSESVAPSHQTAMNDVLQMIAREQSIPSDNISVLSFGGALAGSSAATSKGASASLRPAVLCSSACSDSVGRLMAVKSSGATPLFDALLFAADFIAHHRRAGARPVLILFSDGNDTISLHSSAEALEAVLDGGALIYSVDLGPARQQTSGSAFLRRVSEATGGRYFSLPASKDDGAAAILSAALDDLRASYVVSYDVPSHQAGFHSLRVLPTHNLNLKFHSRNGYNYEPNDR